MIARKYSKKYVLGELSPCPGDVFLDQIWPKVHSFGCRGYQMKNYRFSRRWYFTNDFFDMLLVAVERSMSLILTFFLESTPYFLFCDAIILRGCNWKTIKRMALKNLTVQLFGPDNPGLAGPPGLNFASLVVHKHSYDWVFKCCDVWVDYIFWLSIDSNTVNSRKQVNLPANLTTANELKLWCLFKDKRCGSS